MALALASVVVTSLLSGCFQARGRGAEPAAGATAPAPQEQDRRAGNVASDAPVSSDDLMPGVDDPATAPDDGIAGGVAQEPAIDPATVPLSAEQAACIGLDQPVCAGCHRVPGTDIVVLRPTLLPPHPPGVPMTPQLVFDCGVGD
jgi:hypothetical protein